MFDKMLRKFWSPRQVRRPPELPREVCHGSLDPAAPAVASRVYTEYGPSRDGVCDCDGSVCGVCVVWRRLRAGERRSPGDPTEVRRGRPRRVPPRDPGVRFSWSLNLNSRLDDDLTLSRSFERRALGCNRHAHVRMWRGG
jgi:hypothetical protein